MRDDWVAQLVKHQTLDFGLGHDLTICKFKPHIGLSAVSAEPASDLLSPESLPIPTCAHSLSLSKINKSLKK